MEINGKKVDEYQLKAITTNQSLLLIAAAGSGKTFTIMGKIYHLINNLKINPENILIISFTNKSVNDLKNKIFNNIDIYTFHKLAQDILKHNHISYQLADPNLLEYITNEYFYSYCNEEKKLKLLKKYDLYNYDTFLKSNHLKSLKKLIITFIHLFKTNNTSLSKLKKIYHNNSFIMTIILEIYALYTQELKSYNCLDFDDLIIEATKYTKNYKNYQYIIIDEFQDTSYIRWNLVNSIRQHNNSIIFAVGDDYQSIFKFSGCDLNIFLDFEKLVPDSIILKLKYTYRNSQELIDICSKFISKNTNQIHKCLLSPMHLKNPIKIVNYLNPIKALKKLLNKLIKEYDDILILGRNNFDLKNFIDKTYIYKNNKLIYQNKEINYMSVHSSKGLEASVVILINLTNSIYGFPNKIVNDVILEELSPSDKSILDAEERRLFYVALTRTKNEVYLLTPFFQKSYFVKEIKKIIKS
ncbi:MAG: hypothetical protein E7172_06375 [Firmicutes bacterium]|nr:hypothetical protein [Bacillota bacterium]